MLRTTTYTQLHSKRTRVSHATGTLATLRRLARDFLDGFPSLLAGDAGDARNLVATPLFSARGEANGSRLAPVPTRCIAGVDVGGAVRRCAPAAAEKLPALCDDAKKPMLENPGAVCSRCAAGALSPAPVAG